MIQYRPQRGALKDSVADAKTFDNFKELYEELNFKSIQRYRFDPRVNQELFIVIDNNDNPIGFVYFEV